LLFKVIFDKMDELSCSEKEFALRCLPSNRPVVNETGGYGFILFALNEGLIERYSQFVGNRINHRVIGVRRILC